MRLNLPKLLTLSLLFFALNANAQVSTQWGPDGYVKIENGSGGMVADLEPGDRFSRDHDQAGDINGDGVIDLVIGARSDDDGATDAGALYIVFMNNDGTVQSNQKISMLEGGFNETLLQGNFFGYGVAGIGDYDNDGVPDIAASAPASSNRALYIIHLNSDGTVKSFVKNSGIIAQGLSAIGDINNDGRIDLVACDPNSDLGGTNRGAINILFLDNNSEVMSGSTVNISTTSGGFGTGLQDNDRFGGREVAMLGDIDNDGTLEMAVGAFASDAGKGAIWMLSLNSTTFNVESKLKITEGLNGFTDTLTVSANPNGTQGASFGHALCKVGDLNGDGVPDLMTGANQQNEGWGYILYLNADKTVKTYTRINNTDGGFGLNLPAEDRFSRSMSFLGDLRGDGTIAVNYGGGAGAGSAGALYVLFFKPCEFTAEPGLNHWSGGTTLYSNWTHSTQTVSTPLTFEQCTFKAFETDAPRITYKADDGRCICKADDSVLANSTEGSTAFTKDCNDITPPPSTEPNILLIISDDLGVDYTNGYMNSALLPVTPHLDQLQAEGITFENAWTAPQCTPTRAAIMSGKHGIKTGVTEVPGELDANTHTSIFKELATQTGNAYADAVIGKWHVGPTDSYDGPTNHGVDHFEGVYRGGVSDYYNWDKVENGVESVSTNYATNEFTDDAIDWIGNQNNPWFLWLAHTAPHSPFHTPPDSMYTSGGSGNQSDYVKAIEAMDHSIGRLFDNIDPAVLANTLIIYIGDNGTPNGFVQNYPVGKGHLYQGGVHVPLIVSGKGVTRMGEREDALVNSTDIYATILEAAGANLPGGMYNSLSFNHLLDNSPGDERIYNYLDYTATNRAGWTIRDAQYKYIEFTETGTQEFYDLINDPLETTNLINSLTAAQQTILEEMQAEGAIIRSDWSCQDFIQNGTETAIDTDGASCNATIACNEDNTLSFTNTGCCVIDSPTPSQYSEIIYQDVRTISSNNFPDHDYCHTANSVPEPKYYIKQVDATPEIAPAPTSILTNANRPDFFFGMALNGVIFAPAPATPFIFEDEITGEYNWDWVFEPTTNKGNGPGLVRLDCASAHTGPQGYHYHGSMVEYAESIQVGLSTTTTPPAEPVHIGWASDGFPVLYRFGPDANGDLSLLQPGYQVKSGDRPGDGITAPCGPYNGKYTNDFEHVQGVGDLDECNGVQRNITLETQHGAETFEYFYVITDAFPQISRCMVGTPDPSFENNYPSNNCYTPLVSQTINLGSGQSVTVGNSTYTDEGIYQDILTAANGCDSVVVTTITTYVDINLKVFLEGTYDPAFGEMTTQLNTRGLLPGQTPLSTIVSPTPAGQPYSIAPWNYGGTEGASWTDADYTGDETDWVLVSFRTGTAKNTEVAMAAALLKKDGTIDFPNRDVLSADLANSVYVVIEHRNHIGIMTPTAIPITNGVLTYDFTLNDSYRDVTSFGQKQSSTGEWMMFAGDASQLDVPSFDINGTDKILWAENNGVFDYYSSPDFDLNGDVNGQDKSLWFENNGISSRVPK